MATTPFTQSDVQVRDVYIKTEEDLHRPWITGMSMLHSGDTVVCVDRNNSALKLFDVYSRQQMKRRALEAQPWDVTAINNTDIIISFPEQSTLQRFHITGDSNKLITPQIRNPSESCEGIAYKNDLLACTHIDPGNVTMESGHALLGTVIQVQNVYGKIQPSGFRHIFDGFSSYVPYISYNSIGNAVYASDYGEKCVWAFDLDGGLVGRYPTGNEGPRGIVALKDKIYVCLPSGVFYILQDQLPEVSQIFKVADMVCPQAIYYNSAQNVLYVSSHSGKIADCYIKVLKVDA